MQGPDIINGLFECLSGMAILLHCVQMYKDKKIRGVSMVACCFFAAWGLWNLYYYPHLGQMMSFLGGLFMTMAHTTWIGMMIYYKKKERRQQCG